MFIHDAPLERYFTISVDQLSLLGWLTRRTNDSHHICQCCYVRLTQPFDQACQLFGLLFSYSSRLWCCTQRILINLVVLHNHQKVFGGVAH
jgi:hypothetical protein